MSNNKSGINRRDFLKTLGVAGAGSALAIVGCKKESENGVLEGKESSGKNFPQVPRRRLGKTGVMVPSLSHGIMYNLIQNQIVLHNGLKWGIDYIDTANNYAAGLSEKGLGKFFTKYPEKRKDVFVATKASMAYTIPAIEKKLQTSLKRMKTDYIDLFYGIHAMSDPKELTDDLRKWAESAKRRKLIKHFGITIHKNMAKCLKGAAKHNWIDAIMTSYNFRLMGDPEVEEGIEACYKADIGLVAMKVMGLSVKTDNDKKLVNKFIDKGYTDAQAKLKVVLDDKRIASACITMPSVALITTNVAAVLDKKKVSQNEKKILNEYAIGTCGGYCAGCADICLGALPEAGQYISDIMRYLMYHNSYNDKDKAKRLFAEIPSSVRKQLLSLDYSEVEKLCPQNMPVTSLISEAVRKLA